MSAAARAQSIAPSSLRVSRVTVARDSSCGRGSISPASQRGSVSPSRSEPSSARRAVSEPVVSCGEIASERIARTGPVSIPASISIIETPVSPSPASMAAAIGEAPRYFGSREACTLSAPRGGMASTSGRKICP
jgi:hypothetical protein